MGRPFICAGHYCFRDDKRLHKKGLEQFTGSTGTATNIVMMGVDCIMVFGD